MYIRKVTGGYKCEVYRKGVRDFKTFPTRQEAVDWGAEREEELRTGQGSVSNRSFAAAVDKYLKSHPPTDRFDRTRKNALYKLSFADKAVSAITPEMISSWRDLRLSDVAPGTVSREMTVIRGVFEYARRDLGWIKVNPISDVRSPQEPPPRRRVIADDEQLAILEALEWAGTVETIRHETAAAFLLALETGMRAGEILGLTWTNVRADHVVLPKTKNGDRRSVPLSAKARELLALLKAKRLLNTRLKVEKAKVFHVTSESRDQTFRRACEKAGVVDVHFHDTRSTAITRLAKLLTPLELARMIGHRDLNSLMFYYAEPVSELAAKLDGIQSNQEHQTPASAKPHQAGRAQESPDAS